MLVLIDTPIPIPEPTPAELTAELERRWVWQPWQTDCSDPRPDRSWPELSATEAEASESR